MLPIGQNEAANDELERLKPDFKKSANIDVDFILNKLEVFTNPLLKKFLKQSQELMSAGDIEGLKKCITNREVQLKGTNRAKTTHPGEFDVNEWIGGGELDYRFYNARTIVRDVLPPEHPYHRTRRPERNLPKDVSISGKEQT